MTSGLVGVVGLSHLGIVAAACLAADGVPVTAVDGDAAIVTALAAGRPPIHEPGLESLLQRRAPTFTTDYSMLRHCGVVIFAVDTATDDEHRSDLTALDAYVDKALPWLPEDGVIVVMSQVPVGYTRSLSSHLAACRPHAAPRVYYWVETLVIGDAVSRYRRPERIIIGAASRRPTIDPELARLLERFACPIFSMDYESAELTKEAINFYLATSVTFANALADLCERTGASMRAMLPALRSDRRIGPAAYIRPGLGIAGGNLERDLVNLRTLAQRTGVDDSIFRLILEGSAARYGWLRNAVERHVLAGRARPRVAVWGLAYKKNTSSTKNSVALRLIGEFADRATLVIYDPAASLPEPPSGIEIAPTAAAALAGADALVIVTDWDEFSTWAPGAIQAALREGVVVDAVGALDAEQARAAGLAYVALGEGS